MNFKLLTQTKTKISFASQLHLTLNLTCSVRQLNIVCFGKRTYMERI